MNYTVCFKVVATGRKKAYLWKRSWLSGAWPPSGWRRPHGAGFL